jgi:hypothetical protein
MADNRARLNQRRGGSDSDQDDRGRHHRNRRRRVHGNAQRAVAGIGVERMVMRHLGHSEQRQQGQTQQSDGPESSWLRAATPAEIWL